MEGREFWQGTNRRTFIDWLVVSGITAIFLVLAVMARLPRVDIDLRWAAGVSVACFCYWWPVGSIRRLILYFCRLVKPGSSRY
jgi:hypothetical protein